MSWPAEKVLLWPPYWGHSHSGGWVGSGQCKVWSCTVHYNFLWWWPRSLSALSSTIATSSMWLLSTWNVMSTTEEWLSTSFIVIHLNLNCHMWPAATILEGTGLDTKLHLERTEWCWVRRSFSSGDAMTSVTVTGGCWPLPCRVHPWITLIYSSNNPTRQVRERAVLE